MKLLFCLFCLVLVVNLDVCFGKITTFDTIA